MWQDILDTARDHHHCAWRWWMRQAGNRSGIREVTGFAMKRTDVNKGMHTISQPLTSETATALPNNTVSRFRPSQRSRALEWHMAHQPFDPLSFELASLCMCTNHLTGALKRLMNLDAGLLPCSEKLHHAYLTMGELRIRKYPTWPRA